MSSKTSSIPTTMRVIHKITPITDIAKADASLKVAEVPTPVPKAGEVLIRVERSPINPSDLMTIAGGYGPASRPMPHGVGNEGSGVVVASGGGGAHVDALVGKRVGVWGTGSLWSEYTISDAQKVLPVGDDVTFEQASSSFVNPFTVLGFIDIAKSRNLSTIVHTAAASSLGKMLLRVAIKEHIEVICVVRRASHVEELRKLGARHIVDTSVASWTSDLSKLTTELKCSLAFDAIGGPFTGQLIGAMPAGSEVQLYGGLSGTAISGVSAADVIFAQKTLRGFWLRPYLATKTPAQFASMAKQVAASLTTDLRTDVVASYPMSMVAEALRVYTANMTGNKICIGPHLLAVHRA